MRISVIDRANFIGPKERKIIRSLVEKTLRYLGLPQQSELCLSLVSDHDMRELNATYRQVDTTTDVLSFPQENKFNSTLLGDIVISYETAMRHSRKRSITIEQEMRLLIVHAVLHLVGFDHKGKKQREQMREKEKEILDYLSGVCSVQNV